jgi:hypothetical protein
MNTRKRSSSFSRATLLATSLLLAASCGGGGGGGAGGAFGAFGPQGQVLRVDADSGRTSVEAMGSPDLANLNGFALDVGRDLFYAIDGDRGVLVRLDTAGRVTTIGPVEESIAAMVHDPRTGELIGVTGGSRLTTKELVRIDTSTGATRIVAATASVTAVALDAAMNRLLAIAAGSTGGSSNVIEIDLDTGASQLVFSHPTIGLLSDITFDPVTRFLYGVEGGNLHRFDVGTGSPDTSHAYDRSLRNVAIDHDTGRFFAFGPGRALLLLPTTQPLGNEAIALATLGRELAGLTLDPADGRFFAVDLGNSELVKVDAASGQVTPIALLRENGTGRVPLLRTLAYDSMMGLLVGLDSSNGQLMEVDRSTGACERTGQTLSFGAKLAADPTTGRIFAFDDQVDVVLELLPGPPWGIDILDNNTGLTKVDDLAFDPGSQRLIALHETAGRSGVPMVSSIALVSTNTSPSPEVSVPRGLTGVGYDHATGLFHAFGLGHPRYELLIDFGPASNLNTRADSLGGAWRTGFQAAVRVGPDEIYAIDNDALYRWTPSTRRMRRMGSLPGGAGHDLLHDPDTGHLGLRVGDEIWWVSPTSPWLPKGKREAVNGSRSLYLVNDPASGRVFGIADGSLYYVTLGGSTIPITKAPRADFTVESVAYGPGAVYALGHEAGSPDQIVVRFATADGEWIDLGSVDTSLMALFGS